MLLVCLGELIYQFISEKVIIFWKKKKIDVLKTAGFILKWK